MTDIINNTFLFLTSGAFTSLQRELEQRQASSLADEARRLSAAAEEEMARGAAAAELIPAADQKLAVNMTTIAVWHYDRAAKKFRASAGAFDEVIKLHIRAKYREHFNAKRQHAISRAAAADTAAAELNTALKQKQEVQARETFVGNVMAMFGGF